jgi:hypothetical protein
MVSGVVFRHELMRKSQQTRLSRSPLFVVPIALLAVLLVSMTLSSVEHHHTGSSEATCQICHLNHQPIAEGPSVDRTPVLMQSGATPDLPDIRLAPHIVVERIPARAPPAV